MPRVGKPIFHPKYPWDEWVAMLKKSPTKALYFGPDDFPGRTSSGFRQAVSFKFKEHGLDISTRIVGDEVVVQIND